MVLALEPSRRVTREEYDRMVDPPGLKRRRTELIHGEILPMAPIGPAHCSAVDLLLDLLAVKLSGRARVRCQASFLADDDSEPQPDFAVVPLGNYAKEHPSRAFLIIEVADSSLAHDRKKASLYAASDVDAYWIVDVTARAIEVYGAPRDGQFTTMERVEAGGAVAIAAFPDVVASVLALFPA